MLRKVPCGVPVPGVLGVKWAATGDVLLLYCLTVEMPRGPETQSYKMINFCEMPFELTFRSVQCVRRHYDEKDNLKKQSHLEKGTRKRFSALTGISNHISEQQTPYLIDHLVLGIIRSNANPFTTIAIPRQYQH